MTKRISATDARVHFGEVMRRVAETGETYIVTRGGTEQVAIVPAEAANRPLEPDEEMRIAALLRRVRERNRRLAAAWRKSGLPAPDAAELIRQGREERDGDLS